MKRHSLPEHSIKSELTVINLIVGMFEVRYGKYMDSNAKKYLHEIQGSVQKINNTLNSDEKFNLHSLYNSITNPHLEGN